MRQWKAYLDIESIVEKWPDDLDTKGVAVELGKTVKTFAESDHGLSEDATDELKRIAEDFTDLQEQDHVCQTEVDGLMSELYDLGDLEGIWLGKHKVQP